MTVDSNFHIWEGIYTSFDEAPAEGRGFEGELWSDRNMQAAREAAECLAREAPLEYSLRQRNAVMPIVVAHMLGERKRVSVLDFGGGLGTGYLVLSGAVQDAIDRIDYCIVEVEGICRAAEDLYSRKPCPTFNNELPATGRFDVVHTASTIQYIDHWRAVVSRLASYDAEYLIFADAFIGAFESFVTLQNYYGSRIRHWFLNFDEFVSEVERHGYALAARSTCDARILGNYGPLPMDNFPEDNRLQHSSHLLFRKVSKKQ